MSYSILLNFRPKLSLLGIAPVILLVNSSCSSVATYTADEPALKTPSLKMPYYLPKGFISISFNPTPGEVTLKKEIIETAGKPTVTKTSKAPGKKWKFGVSYVADRNAGVRFAVFKNNPFFKEEIELQTNSEGLLSTSTSKSEDKTLLALENIAGAVLNIRTNSLAKKKEKSVVSPPKSKEFSLSFDPLDSDELIKANRKLFKNAGMTIIPATFSSPSDVSEANGSISKYVGAGQGIEFRPVVFFNLFEIDQSSGAKKLRSTFAIPDSSKIYRVPLRRSVFGNFNTDLKIVNGMSHGFKINKSSEVASFTGFPLRITNSILEHFKGILVYQEAETSANTALLKAKIEEIEKKEELRVLEEKYGD